MCGSLVKLPVIAPPIGVMTDEKNALMLRFNAPSATPVALLNERRRPFTATMNCDGPTAPIVSGGTASVSADVAPVNDVDTVTADGAIVPPLTAAARCAVVKEVDLRLSGRLRRSGRSFGLPRAAAASVARLNASRRDNSSAVSVIPISPVIVTPNSCASAAALASAKQQSEIIWDLEQKLTRTMRSIVELCVALNCTARVCRLQLL